MYVRLENNRLLEKELAAQSKETATEEWLLNEENNGSHVDKKRLAFLQAFFYYHKISNDPGHLFYAISMALFLYLYILTAFHFVRRFLMHHCIFLFMLVFSAIGYGQDRFNFEETGLTPTTIVTELKTSGPKDAYRLVSNWIKNNNYDLIDSLHGVSFQFRFIKENAIQQGKQTYHLRSTLQLTFDKQIFSLTPLYLETKLNSKYDMGWNEIDLKNTSKFFKNGKALKKTKSYVQQIPLALNELYTELKNVLN